MENDNQGNAIPDPIVHQTEITGQKRQDG